MNQDGENVGGPRPSVRDRLGRGNEGRCLVTGASGFIGSHLVEALRQRGYHIRVLVRENSPLRWLEHLDIEFVRGDLRDRSSLEDACDGVRNVFHFGAVLGASTIEDYSASNEDGSRRLAEAFVSAGELGGYFINCSSLAAGGPAIETSSQSKPIRNEGHPDMPITPYGKSKLAGERAISEIVQSSARCRLVHLRPSAVYGPRDSGVLQFFTWIKRGILPSFGVKGARLSLVHVSDVVSAAIGSAEQPVQGTYYITDGNVYTWDDLGYTAAELMGISSLREVRIPDVGARLLAFVSEGFGRLSRRPAGLNRWKVQELRQRHWVCSAEKASAEWDYRPEVTLEDGLSDTLGWYREHGWL